MTDYTPTPDQTRVVTKLEDLIAKAFEARPGLYSDVTPRANGDVKIRLHTILASEFEISPEEVVQTKDELFAQLIATMIGRVVEAGVDGLGIREQLQAEAVEALKIQEASFRAASAQQLRDLQTRMMMLVPNPLLTKPIQNAFEAAIEGALGR